MKSLILVAAFILSCPCFAEDNTSPLDTIRNKIMTISKYTPRYIVMNAVHTRLEDANKNNPYLHPELTKKVLVASN